MFLFYQPHYSIQESIKNIQNFFIYIFCCYFFILFAHTIWLFYSPFTYVYMRLPIQLHYIYIPFQTTYLYYISSIFFLVFVKFFYTHQQGRNKKVILFFGHSVFDKRNFIARNVIPQRFFLNLVIRQDLFHLLVIKFFVKQLII